MSKPSMKYNILSLIKEKLERTSTGQRVMILQWHYNYKNNAIECNILGNLNYIIFESYGEYPMAALHSIIEDHNGNLLIGMSFEEYFQIVKDNEKP
jgi:hypothetical protein